MQLADLSQKYNSSSETQKHTVNVALTLGLLILLVALIYPAIKHITELRKELKQGTDVYNALKDKSTALDKAKANYEVAKDQLDIFDLALPKGSDIKNYLKKPLESLAASNKMALAGLQFSDVPLSDPLVTDTLAMKKITYTIVVSGNFEDFSRFLVSLESFIRTTQVGSVSLTSNKGGQITASLKAETTFLGQNLINTGGAQ